jgi:hypothetical protein
MTWIQGNWFAVIILMGVLGVFVLWRLDGLSFLYDIRVAEDGIEFVFFQLIPFYLLRYSNIEEVRELSGGFFLGGVGYLTALNFKNRFGHTAFLIQKRKGIFTRKVLVTPGSAGAFKRSLLTAGVRLVEK